MAGRRRPGKEPAGEPSGGPVVGNPENHPIVISEQGCTLIIESNKIPGTPLQPATCEGTRYVALSRTIQDACNMHNTLVMCDHPNILKPIGVWTDPSDNRKAYIAVASVDNALNNLAKEQLFCIEGRICRGFSALGFRMFKDIFTAIQYVNSRYEGGATSSDNNTPPIQLFPMMLEPRNIFVKMANGKARVMLGNFKTKLSDVYVSRSSRGARREITRDNIEKVHWKEVGHCLTELYKTYEASRELTELATFLTDGEVTYDSLLWQPGIWDARTKMQFVREIYFLLDSERDNEKTPFESTPRGKVLKKKNSLGLLPIMKEFSPPMNENTGQEKPIKENHLLDSVIFLRNKIVAHFDDEYRRFKGSKGEVYTIIQSRKDDYMITLARTIRELGWIPKSPVTRGENDYMACFYTMKI
ncbi:uncharacterized protein LOC120684976 [Panicum virgatum]|uniref:uncharacterized protein LOC120684976 n=1 Tax=Panicum virgatum TaxID=38727 RepID=UPI0019D66C0C|nr:uncharacterized protein LOC120684976 [Panicum virgatum]